MAAGGSLKLSRASLAKTTVGHIVNLMSNDFSTNVCYLLVAPIQTGIAVYIIYTEIGYYCFVGIYGQTFLESQANDRSVNGQSTAAHE
ncbi:unnamed protein product [Oppiella nova]|uniref:Uncharacterized protein n=1 Tax=Oppiella nova TaxID=334625 RepID=A0A7R9QTZ5_9ACAR|nr:unnamed protein product [Oppiella nova]CAG2175582.1 unnamed protein product [Oppiella nova]